jgi:hypothetical protein
MNPVGFKSSPDPTGYYISTKRNKALNHGLQQITAPLFKMLLVVQNQLKVASKKVLYNTKVNSKIETFR